MRPSPTELEPPRLTAEEFERLPDDGYRSELVRGLVIRELPAGGEHGVIAMQLTRRVATFVYEQRLGHVLSAETGFILQRKPDTVRAPDIAFVRRERIEAEGVPRGYWPGAPDLAVEVVSPSNTLPEIHDKVQDYLNAGCTLVWVVEPRSRRVTVYRSMHDISLLTAEEELDGGNVLPGFRVRIAELFEE